MLETDDHETVRPWLLTCPAGHPGVQGMALRRADIAIITITPTSLVRRDTGELETNGNARYQLELRNNTGQTTTLPINVDWRRLRDLLERLQGKSYEQALDAAGAFPELSQWRRP